MNSARASLRLIDELARQVLAPLVMGGRLTPLPPVGSARALAAVECDPSLPDDIAIEIATRRGRTVRRLFPVDHLPGLAPAEWLLGFALNDLLQATNPDLAGWLGRERPQRLIEMSHRMLDAAGAPASIADALGRHATLARLASLTRIDTTVSWWVGSETFRGQVPPARLTAWPELRRVRRQERVIDLCDMPPPDAPWRRDWIECLARLYAASPLTDLAGVGRSAPAFAWTGASFGLTRVPMVRCLACRAIERHAELRHAADTLREAASQVAPSAARAHAEQFAAEIAAWAAR